MRARIVAIAATIGIVAAACGTSDQGVIATRSRENREPTGGLIEDTPADDPVDDTTPDFQDPAAFPVEPGVVNFGEGKPPQPYDGYLIAAIKDIELFWEQEYQPAFGLTWEPIRGEIWAAFPGRTDLPTGCGGTGTYADVEGNAFYCTQGDFMAYDDAFLIPLLVEQLSPAAAAVVMAHEYGHRVQGENGTIQNLGIVVELQADCFAGAWAARAARGESGAVVFSDADVRRGLVAMINVRDGAETDVFDPSAHGTGFDRVIAFQDGFLGGPARCASFFDEGRENQLVDIDFTEDDLNTLGNLPFEEIAISLGPDLDRFWAQVLQGNGITFATPTVVEFEGESALPSCASIAGEDFLGGVAWCPDDNTVYVDRPAAEALYNQGLPTVFGEQILLGDMSYGYILAQAYGDAVQAAIGSQAEGVARALFNDCLAGAWVRNIVPQADGTVPGDIQLSAGDLDEAVITAIVRSDTTAANGGGSAFEKIDAFRTGVLGGLAGCQ
jgi:predicted metalloprotease